MMQSESSVYAILEPWNLQARLDFDYLVEQLQEQNRRTADYSYIHVNTEQQYDSEIFRFRRQNNLTFPKEYDTVSVSSTEVDTDSEDDSRHSGMIWTGYYTFDLQNPPADPILGWVGGRGDPNSETTVEIPLGREDKRNDVRSRHILFNFHHNSTGFLSVLSRASQTGRNQVTVNGISVARGMTHSLNQSPTIIRLGTLEYRFKYTSFATSEIFNVQRAQYLRRNLGTSAPTIHLAPTPTEQARMFGIWTLNAPLGKGTLEEFIAPQTIEAASPRSK
jgi:hypothetical protein